MDFRSIFIPTLLVKMLRTGLSAGGEGRERQWILTQCTNTAHRCLGAHSTTHIPLTESGERSACTAGVSGTIGIGLGLGGNRTIRGGHTKPLELIRGGHTNT